MGCWALKGPPSAGTLCQLMLVSDAVRYVPQVSCLAGRKAGLCAIACRRTLRLTLSEPPAMPTGPPRGELSRLRAISSAYMAGSGVAAPFALRIFLDDAADDSNLVLPSRGLAPFSTCSEALSSGTRAVVAA